MIHFVCRQFCGLINWVEFCQEVFGENKYLCVREFADHYHLHFHGYTEKPDHEIKAIQSKYLQLHSCRKKGDERLFAKKKGEATEGGFNYILKDKNSYVVSTTLTQEEQDAYVKKSQEHVIKLKEDTRGYVHARIDKYQVEPMDEEHWKKWVKIVKKKLIYMKVDAGKGPNMAAITTQAYYNLLSHPRAKTEDWAQFLV